MPVTEPSRRRPGRPPKVDGSRLATRERLVRAGIEILTEQGFASTGIDAVLKRVGVPKGSFYHYFASKEAFGHAVIEGYAAYFARKLDRWLLDATRSPLERLRDFVADGKAGLRRFEFRRGCLIGNLGQELGGTHGKQVPAELVADPEGQTLVRVEIAAHQLEADRDTGRDRQGGRTAGKLYARVE